MNTDFTENGWNDFEHWLENDKEIADKIRGLIKAIKKDPFKGIGKPNH